ncbi:MAG TPA: ATP-binding protein, partial [Cyanobium sp.]|nr:ATP-binding protein [Cyanobium sp.]
QALLILLSANWSASKWCDREFSQARSLGKPIFQVIESADGDAGPPIAPNLQVLDLRQEREAGLEQLKKQLSEIALTAQGGFPWNGTRPPYPGLLTFEEEDAPIYFGRDEEIRHLIERLRAHRTLGGPRLLVLLGASGSGKSSLLRAGVLPRLRRSGRGWLVLPPFRPQSQPCQELARALALAAGHGANWRDLHRSLLEGDRSGTLPAVLAEIASDLRMAAAANEAQILLSIDQGEELFGGLEQVEVQLFFRILTGAMGGDLPFLAVMTLRSEFLGRLQAAEKDGFTARFEEVSLAPMPMAQIPAIIKGPARVAGLEVEEAFVQQAAADAETEDALPLLAFALREIYERFGGDRHLSLADYQALGDAQAALSPLENAVRRRADEVLTGMQPSEQQKRALRDAFVPAMVRFEQGNYVRRPARWDALPPEAQQLLEELVNARLLISRQEEGNRLLEVAHEALLRKWPLLLGWLDEDREFLIGSQQLEQDLLDWQKAGVLERPAALLSGLKLQRAKAWFAERPQQLSDELLSFVQASSD